MTFTDMYKGVDLEQLNTMLAAQGKNYEFIRKGDEIICQKTESHTKILDEPTKQ